MGTKVIWSEEQNRSFISKEFDLPHRPNFLSAFLVLFNVFLQFKGIFKGVSRINLLGIIPERFHRVCSGHLCDLEVLTTTILLKICYLAICISIHENTKWWLFIATSLSYYIYYVKNSSFFIAHKSHPFFAHYCAYASSICGNHFNVPKATLFGQNFGFVFSRLLCFPKSENSTVILQSTKIKSRLLGSFLNGKINNKT